MASGEEVPLDRPLRRSADCLLQEIGDDALLVDTVQGRYVKLNSSALAVWSALEFPRREDEVVDELLERFDGPRSTVAHDTRAALRQLMDLRLVQTQ